MQSEAYGKHLDKYPVSKSSKTGSKEVPSLQLTVRFQASFIAPVNRKMWLHSLILILLLRPNFAQLSNATHLNDNYACSCHSSYNECKGDPRSSDMYEAAENGFCKCLEIYLDNGEEVDQTPSKYNNYTPLIYAAKGGHVTCMALLINRGANINNLTIYGETPLSVAAQHGNCKGVQLLIDRGAILDHKVSNIFTALYAAAKNGHILCVKALVDAGADVNIQRAGKTMLA